MNEEEEFQFRARAEAEASPAPKYGSGLSFDAVQGGQVVPTGSPEARAAYSPVSGNSFVQNANIGVGKLYTDALLGARQMTGQAPAEEAINKREIDAPISQTAGGRFGEIAGALPLAFVPGANTYAGAALLGGGLGALQPTVGDESRLFNTAAGTALGVGGKYTGDVVSNWLTGRAAQPFFGWNQKSGNAAAARSVGSDASALDQPAISKVSDRFNKIFGAARDPNTSVQMTGSTAQEINNAAAPLNQSSRSAFVSTPEVQDLMAHLRNGGANAEQLGNISSQLGTEASAQMSSKAGDRKLGQALFSLKDHVDDLIGQNISDPALKAAYDAARPQYRNFLTMTGRPTILNSATGDVNLRNLGNYLQRYDKPGYLKGVNTSDLYEAARFGQATGLGSRPPPPILQPVKWAAYHATNNPVVGAIGGTVSRIGAPAAPAIRAGLAGLAPVSTPELLAYFEQ